MLIFLADLTHIGSGVATEAMPLNIGLLKSHIQNLYPNRFSIELFKYPEKLLEALSSNSPSIVGFSNYTWNSNLAYYFSSLVKKNNPDCLVVWGGTNYPFLPSNQEDFLRKREFIDIHVNYEGEETFAEIVNFYDQGDSIDSLIQRKILGSQGLSNGIFYDGGTRPRIKDLDQIPSPYSNGIMDEFFDGTLTPLVETARGCPFTCNFCNAGDKYFTKVNKFGDAYVNKELTYIAKLASKSKTGHITFCDNNFGMLSRDADIAKHLAFLYEKYAFPSSVTVWTGKNSKERVIEATKILGDKLNISMSVQAMDPQVLKEIKRDNIRIEDYKKIADELHKQGRPQHAEVIMPLPGETFDSHINGLMSLIDTNVDRVFSHTLQLLHGTQYKDDELYRAKNAFIIKFRLVPLDFTLINGEIIFDVEEIAVGTSHMNFTQYCDARLMALVIDLSFNTNFIKPFLRLLNSFEINSSEFIKLVFDKIKNKELEFYEVIESFNRDTVNELWDSEKELTDYYKLPKNFKKLQDGIIGGNVLFKHRILMISRYAEKWIEFITECASSLLDSRSSNYKNELFEVNKYVKCLIVGAFDEESIDLFKEVEFSHDIVKWMSSGTKKRLESFRHESKYYFSIHGNKKKVLLDAYNRYGTDISGLVKLIQRTNYSPIFEVNQTSRMEANLLNNENQFYKSL
jgi:radical SAM superfamily enzyme YgiQ (UPF0313 family)